jgi:hypothetical protein
VQIEENRTPMCLLGGDISGESCGGCAFSLRRFIQPKPANSLHGLDMKTEKRSLLRVLVGIPTKTPYAWNSSSHTPYL